MIKIHNLAIVASFAGLWVASLFSAEFEIILGFILIFSFGILHGSNDILLINSISNPRIKYPFFKVLGIYLVTVLSAVILFYFLPMIALIFFIAFSAFHFGEQHWNHHQMQISKSLRNIFYFIYGLLVLQMLFVINPEEVIQIVESITGFTITHLIITYSFVFTLLVFSLSAFFLFLKFSELKSIILLELFYLLVFAIIFEVSSLIWGFTIYFILWHSIPSLYEQVTYIYGAFNKKSIFSYCKNAFPYWLVSLIGLALMYFVFKDQKMFYAIFFSFIAAVTFPHALVINNMFINKKTQSNQ